MSRYWTLDNNNHIPILFDKNHVILSLKIFSNFIQNTKWVGKIPFNKPQTIPAVIIYLIMRTKFKFQFQVTLAHNKLDKANIIVCSSQVYSPFMQYTNEIKLNERNFQTKIAQ